MAAVNGEAAALNNDSGHLGKRKRSTSPEKKRLANGVDDSKIRTKLRNVLEEASKYIVF
jgi:ribosomal protein S20